MTNATDLRGALQQWEEGNRNGFKDFFKQHKNILHTYSGERDVFDFFFPALYIKEFCSDLIEAGFPVEEIFADNLNDFLWVEWPSAQQHVLQHAPQLIVDLNADGPPRNAVPCLGHGEFTDDQRQDILSCLPEQMARKVDETSKQFANSTPEEWQERFAIIAQLTQHPLIKKVG